MKKLIILHGALGSKAQFEVLAKLLETHFGIYTFDFDGHGAKSASETNYSIELFARNLEAFMKSNHIEKPLIFGYSMGGFVALKLESMCPGSIEQLVTLGTKFDWTPASAEKEVKMLNAEKIEEKVPSFAAYLKSLHGEDNWKKVLERTARMMLEMGNEPVLTAADFSQIQVPVQLLRGSKDIMVSEEETEKVREQLADSTYREVANWQHPINLISPEELAQELLSSYLPG